MMDKLNSKQQLEYVRSQVHQAVDMINSGIPQSGAMVLVLLEQELGVALKDSTPAEGQTAFITGNDYQAVEVEVGSKVLINSLALGVSVQKDFIGKTGKIIKVMDAIGAPSLYTVRTDDGKATVILYRQMFYAKVHNV